MATTTGWAFGRPGDQPTFSNWRLMKRGQSRGYAYRHLRNWLDSLMEARDHPAPQWIVYESPIGHLRYGKTNVDTTRLLVGLAENLEEWAHARLELREATPAQVRAHFLGRNMPKAEAKPLTLKRCHELGWMAETTDESDALALWDYQACFLHPEHGSQTTRLFSG